MSVNINPTWQRVLSPQWEMPYFLQLSAFLHQLKNQGRVIYPPGRQIFAAFDACNFEDVKVVIIGQDPYHGPGQANGLCFSVNDGVKLPPSLVNIYKEIADDLGKPMPESGNLERWARQGVLLLNSVLTVEPGQAGAHQGKGWEQFTDAVVEAINQRLDGVVFMLWGSYAISKGAKIDRSRHLVLTAPHPSPLSAYRGFFGCKHFSKANDYLRAKGKGAIEW
ncbi:MAG: uracil-DNA glycosylase [Muribaculaceae bacterium]|nr:uracil-DNA glycosylase [Muribaculaceae bacterium]MDE5968361.1 uracil-DNA glycosylase [Muribaculaceae bacterium]